MILHTTEIIAFIISILLLAGIIYIIVKVVTALNKILQRLEDEPTKKNKDKDSNA